MASGYGFSLIRCVWLTGCLPHRAMQLRLELYAGIEIRRRSSLPCGRTAHRPKKLYAVSAITLDCGLLDCRQRMFYAGVFIAGSNRVRSSASDWCDRLRMVT